MCPAIRLLLKIFFRRILSAVSQQSHNKVAAWFDYFLSPGMIHESCRQRNGEKWIFVVHTLACVLGEAENGVLVTVYSPMQFFWDSAFSEGQNYIWDVLAGRTAASAVSSRRIRRRRVWCAMRISIYREIFASQITSRFALLDMRPLRAAALPANAALIDSSCPCKRRRKGVFSPL